jgi:hypothetical protein
MSSLDVSVCGMKQETEKLNFLYIILLILAMLKCITHF